MCRSKTDCNQHPSDRIVPTDMGRTAWRVRDSRALEEFLEQHERRDRRQLTLRLI